MYEKHISRIYNNFKNFDIEQLNNFLSLNEGTFAENFCDKKDCCYCIFSSFNNKKGIYCGNICYDDTLLPFDAYNINNVTKIKKYIKELLEYHNSINKVINLDI